MTRLGQICATLVAAVAISACSGGSEVRNGPAPSWDGGAKVRVQNNNWADMTVVLEGYGRRVRLGTVTSMSKAMLRVPASFLVGSGGVRIVLDPLGGSEVFRSDPVELWPGQVLDLTIQNHVATTSMSVWDR